MQKYTTSRFTEYTRNSKMRGDVMLKKINNLVFEGGGILGISYLGVLEFLSQNNILQNINRVAGTSAGAITACVTSFNLPFNDIKRIADTLDYKKVPQKQDQRNLINISISIKNEFEKIFGDLDCLYRLIHHYGWYSSQYFYSWIKHQIAFQFDETKKLPPYTFADFKNPYIHKQNRPFLDLFIIGTDISYKSSRIFSFETTPTMEVAEAVRISMSIPFFFEAVKINNTEITKDSLMNIFCDGGVIKNYPINIFDSINFNDQIINGVNVQTLGVRFRNSTVYSETNNLLEFIKNLFFSYIQIQQDIFKNSPQDIARSIQIDTKGVSPLNFNLSVNDSTYNYLYKQGYQAAKNFFSK